MKKSSAVMINDFLKIWKKTLKRKKQLIIASKRKLNIDKLKPKTVVISTLDHFGEEILSTLILEVKVLISATKKLDIAIISVDIYCAACK